MVIAIMNVIRNGSIQFNNHLPYYYIVLDTRADERLNSSDDLSPNHILNDSRPI